MALRGNHYDLAFEEYLRARRTPYVAVDETRRTLLEQASLKSMDFIVYSPGSFNLLVDVKGRKFPSGDNGHKWENWATAEDLPSLLKWEEVFGQDFRAVLVFAYDVVDPRYLDEFSETFRCRDRTYSFFGVWAAEYRETMRTRSPKWDTVSLPSRDFQRLRTPISQFLQPAPLEPAQLKSAS